MSQEIKLSSEELKLIALFQKITRATARDVVNDEKLNRLIFVVNEGKMGLAIGKGGVNIKNLQNIIKRPVELVEYSSEPEEFLSEQLCTNKSTERMDICTTTATKFWDFWSILKFCIIKTKNTTKSG